MKKTCVVCRIRYEAYDNLKGGRRGVRAIKSKRRSNSLTCSPTCSKYYMNVRNYLGRVQI